MLTDNSKIDLIALRAECGSADELYDRLPFGRGLFIEAENADTVEEIASFSSDPNRPDAWQTLFEFRSGPDTWWGIESNGDPALFLDISDWLESVGMDRDFRADLPIAERWVAACEAWANAQ